MEEHLVEGVACLLAHPGLHLNAVAAQDLQSFARHQGVGVVGAHHHLGDAGVQDGLGAGGLLALVAAGLQGHVQGGAPGVLGAALQGVALGVGLAVPLVVPLADDRPVFDNHRPHQGVGIGPARPPLCQFQGQVHIVLMVHLMPPGIQKMP